MPLDACYSLDQTLRLLSIPSPTGYPRQVCGALVETLEGLGFSPRQLRKGGVVCTLGGEGRPIVLASHVDTLGLMVRAVKPDGRLAFTCLGGPSLQAVETENVTVITRDGRRYTGVVELRNASKHVNRELDNEKRDDTTLEILLDEEVGHGASCGLPEDTEDLLVVDMGCVGEGLACREQQVSICAKDSSGPYDYEMTGELIALARANGADYAVDVYPAYGSDAGAALRAGHDVRFALIGAGVYASHGYERSHRKGVENTLRLIEAVVTA